MVSFWRISARLFCQPESDEVCIFTVSELVESRDVTVFLSGVEKGEKGLMVMA